MRLALLVTIFVVAAGCQASPGPRPSAAATGTLSLLVTDVELLPLEGARVQVDEGAVQRTDATGLVDVSGLSMGEHVLRVEASGFVNATRRFWITGEEAASLRVSLGPLAAPTEVNHYSGWIECEAKDAASPCELASTSLQGLRPGGGPPPARMVNATLRIEWDTEDSYGFRFEIRRNNSALPFADHTFNQTVSGRSPLTLEIPPALVSPSMRLSWIGFLLHAAQTPASPAPTTMLVGLAVSSEAEANATFPSLTETGRHVLGVVSDEERRWTFEPGALSGIVIVEVSLERECPVGSQRAARLRLADSTGAPVERGAQKGADGEYQCPIGTQVPPPAMERLPLGVQYLWTGVRWDARLLGDCTCRVELRVLEGRLPD